MFELDVRGIAILAGPLVCVGYGLGHGVGLLRSKIDERPDVSVPPGVVEALVAIAWATIAWKIIAAVAPGNGRFLSPIGYLSVQILAAWQSVALWTGAGVVAGVVGLFARRPSSNGLMASAALLAVYAPFVLSAGAAGFVVGSFARLSGTRLLTATLVGGLAGQWVGWVLEGPDFWGMRLGPEVSVWVTALAVLVRFGHRGGGTSDIDLGPLVSEADPAS